MPVKLVAPSVFQFLLAGCLCVLTACATPKDAGKPMTETQLYFGLSRADKTVITESDWRYFVDQEVAPRFPEGLTVINTYGQWTPPEGMRPVQEPSKIIIIVHPDTPRDERHILEITELYKQLFQQAEVLRVDRQVMVKSQ